MHEIVINLHMHTGYSDGSGSHRDIANAALDAGLDAVIITDHNVLVSGAEGYIRRGHQKVLVLTGEEIHDRSRVPQKNHMLVLGARRELAGHAGEAGSLFEATARAGGLSFIAHPYDPAAPSFGEPDISWEDWSTQEYTGLELWNGFSELKSRARTRLHGVLFAYFPAAVARGPAQRVLQRWDTETQSRRVPAFGGSDAHALHMRLGPLHRVVYPYAYHFGAINTHVLLQQPLADDPKQAADSIYAALGAGNAFIAYDAAVSARGFRFRAHLDGGQAEMGDEVQLQRTSTIHASAPGLCELRLLKDGATVLHIPRGQALTYRADQRGVYRVEAYRRFLGQRQGWIFSNPIYLR
jgi:hypothetical protein